MYVLQFNLGSNITIDGQESIISSTSLPIYKSFIMYQNYNYLQDQTFKTQFIMNNLTIKNFKSISNDGGAISLDGDIFVLLSTINFINIRSSHSGGAISVNRNSFSTEIFDCIFDSCSSAGTV